MMSNRIPSAAGQSRIPGLLAAAFALAGLGAFGNAGAYSSADGSLEVHGFVDSTTHQRMDYGLSKQRFRGQVEFSKFFGPVGLFSEFSVHGVLRATYDAAYDFNDDQFGDEAGRTAYGSSSGIPNGTATGLRTPWGNSPVTAGNPALPGGGGFGFNHNDPNAPFYNPATGLKRVGGELSNANNAGQFGGGLEFWTPVRPCDEDNRGCLSGYLDRSENDLRMQEFRDDHRWLREIYIDATLPISNGDEINFRIGRQQVVWGRTDLFRVLDQVNPIDFSIQNIYEEFEDSRIPLGIFSAEYRMGATGAFDDLNFQFIWNFEDFTPNDLGQGGQPYNILLAGDVFRALANCWDNGCTVSNFATGLSPAGNLATDFPRHVVGIRDVRDRGGNDQFGMRLEGVFKSVGFSFNALYYYSQLPSLRGIENDRVVNPFLAPGVGNPLDPTVVGGPAGANSGPWVPAFDVHFPRILLLGASADFYVEELGSIPLKSAFRVEFAYTQGEEFANTSRRELYSESDVIRWVVGWDRPTFWRALNPNRSFLISAQMFGQHLVDHERFASPITGAPIGMADWDHNFIATLLVQGFYMNDRVLPRWIMAYDVRAQAGVIGPAVDWLVSDNWRVTLGANIKFGKGPNVADDGRTSNSFPPFTAGPACPLPPGPGGPAPACFPNAGEFSSIGIRNGFEPLGRFRSGPLGMAQHEDELQLLVRWRF
jgi:hypothetical protein